MGDTGEGQTMRKRAIELSVGFVLGLGLAISSAAQATDPLSLVDADLDAGQESYRQCVACHALEPNKHRTGPSLAGFFGRPFGQWDDYTYSDGMNAAKDAGGVWDAETLDAFLKRPRRVVKGTKMAFRGVRDDEERRNLVAYLKKVASP